MTLDKLQQKFVDEVLHGNTHLILTGRDGTGKSTELVSAVMAAQAAEMVAEAWDGRKPGGIAYGYGYAVVAHRDRKSVV